MVGLLSEYVGKLYEGLIYGTVLSEYHVIEFVDAMFLVGYSQSTM